MRKKEEVERKSWSNYFGEVFCSVVLIFGKRMEVLLRKSGAHVGGTVFGASSFSWGRGFSDLLLLRLVLATESDFGVEPLDLGAQKCKKKRKKKKKKQKHKTNRNTNEAHKKKKKNTKKHKKNKATKKTKQKKKRQQNTHAPTTPPKKTHPTTTLRLSPLKHLHPPR